MTNQMTKAQEEKGFIRSIDRIAISKFLEVQAQRLRTVTVAGLIARWERVTGAEAREEVYQEARKVAASFDYVDFLAFRSDELDDSEEEFWQSV